MFATGGTVIGISNPFGAQQFGLIVFIEIIILT